MRKWISFPRTEGKASRQAHADLPSGTFERLLKDARRGRRLRHSVLNLLWGALFTELWLREHGAARPLESRS